MNEGCRGGCVGGISMTIRWVCAVLALAGGGCLSAEALEPRLASIPSPDADLAAAPVFRQLVLAGGLSAPDGLAVHPGSGKIFVSEEDAARVCVLHNQNGVPVVDRDTPVYERRDQRRVRADPLRAPEGIAFDPRGRLYVAEDCPDGRLLVFDESPSGAWSGEVVPVPGGWDGFAWEGLAVGPGGEVLLAGSDMDAAMTGGSVRPFSGVILYRDTEGEWWAPYRRLFASFSSAAFTRGGHQAVYTCEVSGELGWLDLRGRRPIGGCSMTPLKAPEGVAVLPDGRLVAAQENGTLIYFDPGLDQHTILADGLGTLESVIWDNVSECLLLADDAGGRVVAMAPAIAYSGEENRMEMAVYHPLYSPRTVPGECPEYLARVLAYVGVRFDQADRDPISFRDFTERVPLVAADAVVECMDPEAETDPLERVQFVVFKPNKMLRGESGPQPALALFATCSRAGRITATRLLRAETSGFTFDNPRPAPLGYTALAVPMASGLGVSALGVATIHFLGLGKTPDYSIVLNPRMPVDSYLVVHQEGGRRVHYRMTFPSEKAARDSWVVAFSEDRVYEWPLLGR